MQIDKVQRKLTELEQSHLQGARRSEIIPKLERDSASQDDMEGTRLQEENKEEQK